MSHRFCGPLINFGHTFAKMAEGDFSSKVHLRKNDFLKAEAAQVNAIIDRLNNDRMILGEYVNQITANPIAPIAAGGSTGNRRTDRQAPAVGGCLSGCGFDLGSDTAPRVVSYR